MLILINYYLVHNETSLSNELTEHISALPVIQMHTDDENVLNATSRDTGRYARVSVFYGFNGTRDGIRLRGVGRDLRGGRWRGGGGTMHWSTNRPSARCALRSQSSLA